MCSDDNVRAPTLESSSFFHTVCVFLLSSQIKWVLEDEALCIPLLYKDLSVDTVSRVIAHTSESASNENCYQELLPISFVFGVNRCLERFINVSWWQCVVAYT